MGNFPCIFTWHEKANAFLMWHEKASIGWDDQMQGSPVARSMADPPYISPWHEEANPFPHVT